MAIYVFNTHIEAEETVGFRSTDDRIKAWEMASQSIREALVTINTSSDVHQYRVTENW